MRSVSCFAVLTATVALLAGCDDMREILKHPTLQPSHTVAVRPSAPPTELLEVVIAGEREVGPLARSLHTTVEDLVRDNGLVAGTPLHDQQVLRVRASRQDLDRYVLRRAERAERRARAQAERAAKRAAMDAAKKPHKRRKHRRRKPAPASTR